MLKIKYIEEFQNGYPFLVIIADKVGFEKAYMFFKGKKEAFINDKEIVEYSELGMLTQDELYMSKSECHDLANLCKHISLSDDPCHFYFDTEALKEVEIMGSLFEYDDGIFDEYP
jgi:hypothetical protein